MNAGFDDFFKKVLPSPPVDTEDPIIERPQAVYDPKFEREVQDYETGQVELFGIWYRYHRHHLLKPAEQIMIALLQDILDGDTRDKK